MDISDKDFENIVNAVVEKILIRMPEVIGNLMQHHAMCNKLNHQFYTTYPEFTQHKELVRSVIESIEGKNPAKKYEDILALAAPEIRQKLGIMKALDTQRKPNKVSTALPREVGPNGAL